IAIDGDHSDRQPEAELKIGQPRAPDLGARLLGYDEVRAAHEASEVPDEQQIGMDLLRGGEVEGVDQRVRADVLGEAQEPEHDLQAEEQYGGEEIRVGDALRFVGHGGAAPSATAESSSRRPSPSPAPVSTSCRRYPA